MEAKPTIQILAEKLILAKRAEYAIAYKALKWHLNNISDEEFAAEIGRASNPDIFGQLWSMGLNAARQSVASEQWEELTG